jgi:hypothetical protein
MYEIHCPNLLLFASHSFILPFKRLITEVNENENTTYWTAKAVLRGKFITMSAYDPKSMT